MWSITSRVYELRKKTRLCHRCPLYLRGFSLDVALQYYCMYELLDPETTVQRVRPYALYIRIALLFNSFPSTLSSGYLWNCLLDIALQCTVSTTPGKMKVDCGSWIPWLVRRIRSCADKLQGGWKRDTVSRTAKRYDDDDDDKYVALRLLLAVLWRRKRLSHKRTDVERQRTEAQGENTRSSRYVV